MEDKIKNIKVHIKLLLKYFSFNLKCNMEYRVSFLSQVIGMIINNSAFLFFWWVIFRNVSSIQGYSFSDVLILWGLASSTYAVNFLFFGNVLELSSLIISGGLDSFLVQPKDVVINSSAARMEVSAWGDLLYGFIIFALSGRFSLFNLLLFTVFAFVGGIIFFATMLFINSLAFYLGNIESSKRIFEMFFLTFSTYPEGIYGKYIRMLFYTFIPVGFMAFMPVGVIKSFSIIRLLIIFTAAFVYISAAYIIFYKGLARYESGNLMDGKL